MHVNVLLFKGLERYMYINLYMYSLLHVLLSILTHVDTIYCYIILYLVYMYPGLISKMVPPCSHLVATRYMY